MPERELLLGHGWRQGIRSAGFKTAGVKGVVLASVPFIGVHASDRLDKLADGGSQDRFYKRDVRECRRGDRVRPVLLMQLFQVVGVFQPAQWMQECVVGPVVFFRAIEGFPGALATDPTEYIRLV